MGEAIREINEKISVAERQYQRLAGSVKLIAVSKTQSADSIYEAFQAGQTAFGENYLQEALGKMSTLADSHIEWHFIGQLQSNKTKAIAEHFAWVHSVESEFLAKRLNQQRPLHLPPLSICLQVNLDNEPDKSGIDLNNVLPLAQTIANFSRLQLRGLMAIPHARTDFDEQRQVFHRLRQTFLLLQKAGFAVDTLSMGMSDDFTAAIAEGSTMVRIGTAIFGKRKSVL